MKSAGWIALLERIPLNQYDNLMLVTTNGIEMSILNILRVEEDFVVIRGRMSGTDLGRILFLPFDRITYLGFQKNMKEVEVQAMFGETPIAVTSSAPPEPRLEPQTAPPATPVNVSSPLPPEPAAPSPPPPPSAGAGPPRSRNRVPVPDKNAMLERMRARSQAGMQKPPAVP